MSIMTITTSITPRSLRGKSRRWLSDRIQELERVLKQPQSPDDSLRAMTIPELQKRVLALYDQIPEDADA